LLSNKNLEENKMSIRLSLYNTGVGIDTFFTNRLIELRSISRNLKKKWKDLKQKVYFRFAEWMKDKIHKKYESFNNMIDSLSHRRDKFLSKYYENGGEYQYTQDVVVKISKAI
jgi:hypothetical protein